MSQIIDFNSRFTADYIAWCQKHPEISNDEDKLEELLPEQTLKWNNSPKKWLNGKTPVQYFEEINDAQIYISLLVSYTEEDIQLPEPLIDCIVAHKKETYPIMRNIMFLNETDDIHPDALSEVRAKIVSLIDEMCMEHPYGQYISLLLAHAAPDDNLTEAICIALEQNEKPCEVRKALLDAYPFSDGTARECILDLLCGFEDDGTVCSILSEEFKRSYMDTAFIADLAGKLGDERLLPYLRAALAGDTDYVTHTAIRYAIEQITGEELAEKDYSGDPVFDYLVKLDLKEDE